MRQIVRANGLFIYFYIIFLHHHAKNKPAAAAKLSKLTKTGVNK